MFTIESKFIGDFKVGDNIAYNLQVLELLYEKYDESDAEDQALMCKPIIVALGAIVEAALHDLHTRIRQFTREGVKNITETAKQEIREMKKLDDFGKYITAAKTLKLFDPADESFYNDLELLRKLRNRVHIQNTKKQLEADERNVFTPARKVMAEKVAEKTLRTLSRKFARGHDHVVEFELPWNAYFA